LANRSKNRNISKCQILACNCENTFSIDAKKLARDLDLPDTPEIHHNLCRAQLAVFEKTVADNNGQKVIVTCTQEAPLFQELSDEAIDVSFVNIRENAGWSGSGKKSAAKIAALIAEAEFEVQPTGLLPVTSQGTCIVYGPGQAAMDVAGKLAGHLSVSLLLSDADDVFPPGATQFPVHQGTVSRAGGSIGKFSLTVDNYAPASPSSRKQLEFLAASNGQVLETDLIFDLSGGESLLGAGHGRDGYMHVDPVSPVAVAEAMFEIIDLVGEFEKPIFVSYDKSICAHSRSGQTGCNNCIDNCPTSAITSDGDHIVVDNEICDGCGHCSSSCPTGAISYAFPSRADLIGRAQILQSTYLAAGGKNPVLFVHESNHGGELIAAMARFGDGLAANVLPLSVHSITQIGHDALTAFFTAGAQSVVLLAAQKNRDQLAALEFQIELTNTFLNAMGFDENMRVTLLVQDDPDGVAEHLSAIPAIKTPAVQNFTASKNKRETARLAIGNLNAMAPQKLEMLDLPVGSPYGAISINTETCTLCLACIGSCPASALGDHEDRPLVSFTEHACVQCGLCRSTCPENAISLTPQFNFDKSALSPVVLNTDEPLECTRCGKPFGSKSAIDKVKGILAGKNPMFQTSEQLALLKMCDDCRVMAMSETEKDPMAFGTVPKTLTADDFLPEDDDEPTRH